MPTREGSCFEQAVKPVLRGLIPALVQGVVSAALQELTMIVGAWEDVESALATCTAQPSARRARQRVEDAPKARFRRQDRFGVKSVLRGPFILGAGALLVREINIWIKLVMSLQVVRRPVSSVPQAPARGEKQVSALALDVSSVLPDNTLCVRAFPAASAPLAKGASPALLSAPLVLRELMQPNPDKVAQSAPLVTSARQEHAPVKRVLQERLLLGGCVVKSVAEIDAPWQERPDVSVSSAQDISALHQVHV